MYCLVEFTFCFFHGLLIIVVASSHVYTDDIVIYCAAPIPAEAFEYLQFFFDRIQV